MNHSAFGLIDGQCGFMPLNEGQRLGLPGFGELSVPDGEQIVVPVNHLLSRFAAIGADVFTTQDWHPAQTAYFSDAADFTTTWAVHCAAGTPGAELHPSLQLPDNTDELLRKPDAAAEQGRGQR